MLVGGDPDCEVAVPARYSAFGQPNDAWHNFYHAVRKARERVMVNWHRSILLRNRFDRLHCQLDTDGVRSPSISLPESMYYYVLLLCITTMYYYLCTTILLHTITTITYYHHHHHHYHYYVLCTTTYVLLLCTTTMYDYYVLLHMYYYIPLLLFLFLILDS